jgi:hypothetical protein
LLPSPPAAQNCDDSAFCKRLRGTTGGEAYVLLPESVQVDGARVTATVQNTENANGTFYLVLTAYGDTLRLFVNEAPEKGRWQVPDVLLPGLEGRQQVSVHLQTAAVPSGSGVHSLDVERLAAMLAEVGAVRHTVTTVVG